MTGVEDHLLQLVSNADLSFFPLHQALALLHRHDAQSSASDEDAHAASSSSSSDEEREAFAAAQASVHAHAGNVHDPAVQVQVVRPHSPLSPASTARSEPQRLGHAASGASPGDGARARISELSTRAPDSAAHGRMTPRSQQLRAHSQALEELSTSVNEVLHTLKGRDGGVTAHMPSPPHFIPHRVSPAPTPSNYLGGASSLTRAPSMYGSRRSRPRRRAPSRRRLFGAAVRGAESMRHLQSVRELRSDRTTTL